MQNRYLYEYTTIRIVPRVERAEFFNVGILLYSKEKDFLDCLFHLDKKKLYSLDNQADIILIDNQLEAFKRIAQGNKSCKSPIASMEKASRFRWLSANKSTIVQCSATHPGYSSNLEKTIEKLMNQYVF